MGVFELQQLYPVSCQWGGGGGALDDVRFEDAKRCRSLEGEARIEGSSRRTLGLVLMANPKKRAYLRRWIRKGYLNLFFYLNDAAEGEGCAFAILSIHSGHPSGLLPFGRVGISRVK